MDPVLHQIADHLAKLSGGSALDPLTVKPNLLPHLFILEVVGSKDGQLRLRIRLTGTALDRAFGRNLRGAYLEDFLHGPRSSEVLGAFHRCATDHRPIWMRQVVEISGGMPRFVEGVAFFAEPDLIYGGLLLGEIARDGETAGFESACL